MITEPICFTCKHFKDTYTCAAFPAGIPNEILTSQNDHEAPLPGQGNDIVYTPLAGKDE